MNRKLLVPLAAALFCTSPSVASDIGYDLNIHIGNRSQAPIIVDEPPLFLVPPTLGFQVAVGVPYDMFRIDGRYYLCRDRVWYAAPRHGGPWVVVQRDRLPPGLAKRRYAEIITLRDKEYVRFKKNRDHYRWDRDHDHYRRDRDHYRDHYRGDRDDYRTERGQHESERDHYRREAYHPEKWEKGDRGKGKNKYWKGDD